MPANARDEIYQLKITLDGLEPAIWRRVLVGADSTLAQVHKVLQIVMGWQDRHLHEFRIGNERYGVPAPPLDRFADELDCIDERKVRLADVLPETGGTARYIYDFGDDWSHTLLVEEVRPPEPETVYPVCAGGERGCPPEDCNGIYGYFDLLEALGDPAHKEHASMLQWSGGKFDPEQFSVSSVNRRLSALRRRRRKPARK